MLETTHQVLYVYIYIYLSIYIYSCLLYDRWSLDLDTAEEFQRTGSFQHVFFYHQPAHDSPLTTALVLRNQTCFLPPAAALGWERRNAATPRPRRSWKVFIMFPMD